MRPRRAWSSQRAKATGIPNGTDVSLESALIIDFGERRT